MRLEINEVRHMSATFLSDSEWLGGRAAKPPKSNWTWERGVTVGNSKRRVIESVVQSVLEEVGVSVGVLGGIVDVVRDTFPVRDGSRIGALHRGPLIRVKLPVLTSLEEIYLPIPTPDESSIEVVRDSLKTF